MLAFALRERSTILDEVFRGYEGCCVCLRLWDEWHWVSHPLRPPKCTLVLHSPETLADLLVHPSEITLGEAFIDGKLDVEGDLIAAFDVAEYLFHRPEGDRQRWLETITHFFFSALKYVRLGSTHSVSRDQWAISQHYDQPVEFFRPWLGSSLVYSCAYFESAEEELVSAQAKKLEMICRKLRLERDDRFLDIGCGWGSLMLHAASQHQVYAQGITVSREQARVAVARIEAEHMMQSCRVDLMDYRLAPREFNPFNKIASIGMFEHVGLRNLNDYFLTVRNMLKPGGIFLNHGIACASRVGAAMKMSLPSRIKQTIQELPFVRSAHTSSFIDKYVFPDGELSTISEAVTAAETAGFEVRDVENLREHYDLTLRAWVKSFEGIRAQIVRDFSEKTYRLWLLYLAGSAAAFRRGDIAVYQMLLCRLNTGQSGLPLTRNDWYVPWKEKD